MRMSTGNCPFYVFILITVKFTSIYCVRLLLYLAVTFIEKKRPDSASNNCSVSNISIASVHSLRISAKK